jgi:hypothetical protein
LFGMRPALQDQLAQGGSSWADRRRHRTGAAVVLTLKRVQRFESSFLQRRACELSSAQRGVQRA